MAKAFEFTLSNETISKKIQMLGQQGIDAGKAGLYRVGQEIMTDSKTNYVPVDTGALRSTGRVDFPVVDGNMITVTLGFGGPAGSGQPPNSLHTGRKGNMPPAHVGYAAAVHENPNATHPVGSWKYLETPLKAHSKDVLPAVARELDRVLPK